MAQNQKISSHLKLFAKYSSCSHSITVTYYFDSKLNVDMRTETQ